MIACHFAFVQSPPIAMLTVQKVFCPYLPALATEATSQEFATQAYSIHRRKTLNFADSREAGIAREGETMNKTNAADQHFLLDEQYKDASNFNTRLHLLRKMGQPPVDLYAWIFSQVRKTPGSHVLE